MPRRAESSSDPIQCDATRICESPSTRGGGSSKRMRRKLSITPCSLLADTDPQLVEQTVKHVLRPWNKFFGKVLDEEVPVGQELLKALHVAPQIELAVTEQGLAQMENESILGIDVLDVTAGRMVSRQSKTRSSRPSLS